MESGQGQEEAEEEDSEMGGGKGGIMELEGGQEEAESFIIMIMKNFNRCDSHGHHGSKHRELAQRTLTWISRIHSHTYSYINTVTSTWYLAVIFQCMLVLFVFP